MGTTYRELFKLYDLIQNGDTRSVEQFFSENKIEINVILPCKGIGVLHLAVGIEDNHKSKECTEIILKNGGDPNLSNDDGITPVHIAAIWGKVDNMKLLIGCGGDPSRPDYDGISAFDYAVREQQWEVYDYLHNVVDQSDDCMGPQCAYTLGLERILVTTDQMVAEYEPLAENQNDASSNRKSEMIRDWCDKNSVVINKLYPTILGETCLLENESVPWKDGDFTETIESVNNLNDTDATFKTCASKTSSDNKISGIYPLELTVEKSVSAIDLKRRESVCENISIPGSPSNIFHKNYNSRTNLRTGKNITDATEKMTLEKCSLLTEDSEVDLDKALIVSKNKTKNSSDASIISICSDLNKLAIDRSSLLTEESRVDIDRALAVVQNRTNEWLSSCDEVKPSNTRRSSASSGVSSSFSGSIVVANVEEEYKYKDEEEDVVLIEKRLLVSSVVLPVDEATEATTADQTILSMASSLPYSMEYDIDTLRLELMGLGFTPGPIQQHSKTLYLKKLKSLKKNPIVVQREGKTYSVELEKSLRSVQWIKNPTPYLELEAEARADFENPTKKWREGNAKTSFTYLLLDPRLTDNLPAKCAKQTTLQSWTTFVNSIFYVGKGKRSRPYSHLYQALTLWKSNFKTSSDKKIQHILDIWSDKVGVICLHVFQNVIPAEAFTYEAAMIDVIGISNLRNLKCGNYYGIASSWPVKERRMLGLHLLYKSMQIFFNEGERQLRPEDID